MIVRTLAGVAGKAGRCSSRWSIMDRPRWNNSFPMTRGWWSAFSVGPSGTTLDAFHQLWEAKKYGARVALYGRMINNSEHQLTFIEHLRALADGQLQPVEAVRSYHAALARIGVRPYRKLDDDLQSTLRAAAYGGDEARVARPSERREGGSTRQDRGAGFHEDEPGGKGGLESPALEADSGIR